jgi:hypothetical protein
MLRIATISPVHEASALAGHAGKTMLATMTAALIAMSPQASALR